MSNDVQVKKDAHYHETAIQYNHELSVFAHELSKRLDHPEIARWSMAVSKQHSFHEGRHKTALKKLEKAADAPEDDSNDGVEETKIVEEASAPAPTVDAAPDATQAAQPVQNTQEV